MSESTPPPTPDSGSADPTLAGSERSSSRRGLWIGVAAIAVIVIVAAAVLIARPWQADADTDATLTVGLTLEPTNLDIRATSGIAIDQVLIDNVYEGLVTRGDAGAIEPSLATEWDVSDDGLTYTFTLAEGITFSTGTPVDATTAAQSIQSVIDEGYLESHLLASVQSIEAPSATELVITLSEPYPDLLWALSGRAGLVLDPAETNDLATTAIGSGPFVLDTWTQGDSLTLVRNDDYWGDEAQVATVVFRYITDINAAVNALQSGDLDVLAPIDANLAQQISTDDFDVVEGEAPDVFTLALNNNEAPLDDVRVRQAIRHAIDRDAIIEARGGVDIGLGGPIPPNDPGYEDLTDVHPYDPDEARRLLDEAGYGDGLDLTLTIASFYGDTFPNLLTSQFADVGITLTTESVEFATWLSDVFTNADYQLSIVDHAESRDFGNWANPEYYFGYDNPEVQDLYAQSQRAATVDESEELLAEAARIVAEDAAADFLVNFRTVTAIRDGVTGFPTDDINSRLNVSGVQVAS